MKINLNTEIITLEGEKIYSRILEQIINPTIETYNRDGKDSLKEFIDELNRIKGEPLTIKKVFIVCMFNKNDNEIVDADEAMRRYLVAAAMKATEEFELDEKDREIIVKAMPRLYDLSIVGFIMNELKGTPKESKEK